MAWFPALDSVQGLERGTEEQREEDKGRKQILTTALCASGEHSTREQPGARVARELVIAEGRMGTVGGAEPRAEAKRQAS